MLTISVFVVIPWTVDICKILPILNSSVVSAQNQELLVLALSPRARAEGSNHPLCLPAVLLFALHRWKTCGEFLLF